MTKYVSVIDYKCPVCRAEEKPTEIVSSELPPRGQFSWGDICDRCLDAMTPEQREAHHKSQAEKVRLELVELANSGNLEKL